MVASDQPVTQQEPHVKGPPLDQEHGLGEADCWHPLLSVVFMLTLTVFDSDIHPDHQVDVHCSLL